MDDGWQASGKENDVDRYVEAGRSCNCLGLRQAARAVTQFYDRALEPSGLRVTQFSILAAIRVMGPASVNRLADVLVMDRTTLSRNVELLEEEGLTERRRSPEDGRVREILLTEEGRRRLETAYPLWEKAQREVEESLGPDRARRMRTSLERAVEATWDTA